MGSSSLVVYAAKVKPVQDMGLSSSKLERLRPNKELKAELYSTTVLGGTSAVQIIGKERCEGN